MKTIQKIIPILLVVLLISCKKEKVVPKVKETIKTEETKANEAILKDRLAVDYKIEHLQTLADLERIKLHFIEETDRFKLENDVKKLKQRLSKLKHTSNKDFNKSIITIENQIKDLEKSIKNGDKNTAEKIDKLSEKVKNEVKNLDAKTQKETTKISDDLKKQYAEIKAKTNLYKAKIAFKNNNFDKADLYLDKAYANYEEAKKYGDANYKREISNLQNQIKALKDLTNTEKSEALEVVIVDVEENH
jgi:hypothetical protein